MRELPNKNSEQEIEQQYETAVGQIRTLFPNLEGKNPLSIGRGNSREKVITHVSNLLSFMDQVGWDADTTRRYLSEVSEGFLFGLNRAFSKPSVEEPGVVLNSIACFEDRYKVQNLELELSPLGFKYISFGVDNNYATGTFRLETYHPETEGNTTRLPSYNADLNT